ncbi:hypothetical protein BDW66DRAFT_155203 [Aspergillus desertorum]
MEIMIGVAGAEAAIQVEDRRKTNADVYKINEDFFRPRGLYCLVMTWEQESDATFNLDAIAASGSESEIKNIKKREFLADYFDRRGQAKFTFENPTSDLNIGPKPTFTSRYADPSHPASSGDLFSLVNGRHISRDDVRPRASERRRGTAGGRFANHPGGNTGVRDLPGGGLLRAVLPARQRGRGRNGYGMYNEDPHTDIHVSRTSEVDQQDQAQPYGEMFLYLMIVNMPSEEEMTAARAMFEE